MITPETYKEIYKKAQAIANLPKYDGYGGPVTNIEIDDTGYTIHSYNYKGSNRFYIKYEIFNKPIEEIIEIYKKKLELDLEDYKRVKEIKNDK